MNRLELLNSFVDECKPPKDLINSKGMAGKTKKRIYVLTTIIEKAQPLITEFEKGQISIIKKLSSKTDIAKTVGRTLQYTSNTLLGNVGNDLKEALELEFEFKVILELFELNNGN